MTLILNNEEVAELLDMPTCIEAMEKAYAGLSRGTGVSRRRSDCLVPGPLPDSTYGLKSMDGVSPELGVGAVRINSDIVTRPVIDGKPRRVKMAAAPGERYCGLVLLFSIETGEPLAIFPDGVAQRMRVGATNGMATKHLARPETPEVGLIGSGWQAGAQLMAMAAVRKVRRVRCYSATPQNRERFSTEMSRRLDLEVVPVESAEAAVKGADVVLCATSSLAPIFKAEWLEPGMHLSSIKRPEVEPAAVRRADRVFIHSADGSPLEVRATGVASPDAGDGGKSALVDEFDFQTLPRLADLVAGKAQGRASETEITCFLNNIGLGFQFAVVGRVAYDKARAQGAGRELPTEWFTQKEHP